MDLFKIGKGVPQGYKLSLCLFNLYEEYIMRNASLDESQTGIIIGKNTDNSRYTNDIDHCNGEKEEELRSLLMRVKEESKKDGLKHSIKKPKILASGPITSWQNRRGKSGSRDRFYFLGLQKRGKQ